MTNVLTLPRLIRSLGIAVALMAAAAPLQSHGQDFPNKRVNMIVPFPPGGGTDIMARLLSEKLAEQWKQPVIVDNRAGAGGMIGTEALAKSPPDGYTIMFHGSGFATAPLFSSNLAFDPMRDIRGVGLIGAPFFLLGSNSLPSSVPDFVAQAKQKPKSVSYGVIPFTTFALDMLLLQEKAGIQLQEIPFNSAVQPINMLMNNELNLWMSFWGPVAEFVKNGKMKAIAVAAASRSELSPSVPTMKEQGIDFTTGVLFGLFFPSKTPAEVANKIAADSSRVVQAAEFAARIKQMGFAPTIVSPDELARDNQSQFTAYKAVADKFGIKPR